MHALSFFAEGLEDAHTAAKRGGGVARLSRGKPTMSWLLTHSAANSTIHHASVLVAEMKWR